ncbi:tail fiber protein [Niveispirillum sp. SYP-B3756]|uniref:tail fiber protein n=1 Tax=Niveispirillum sp. SYP-B3756 TaxID=2662178 RepID=UPI0015664404
MGDYFIGEIRIFSFQPTSVPTGWMQCNGQELTIAQYTALYALLGVQFGGDARTKFNVPDLRGRAIVGTYTGGHLPVNVNTKYPQGITGQAGVESVKLTAAQVPPHIHTVYASKGAAESASPKSGLYANVAGSIANYFIASTSATPAAPLDSRTIDTVGGGGAHENQQPYLTLNFCIATSGVFPSRQ